MAWSPPARQRRSWLVEQAGDYATPISHHIRDGTGFWSSLRSWLRPHRGISQACGTAARLPLYLGFFQIVHNARRRGKALLGALVATLMA
jgi:hypothetical protein